MSVETLTFGQRGDAAMRFLQVDVFAKGPYEGNPLAVFPDAASVNSNQMQAIAREMNLSETTFVTRADSGEYDVRIFTPNAEIPFAGHPTLGTTWVLRHLGILRGNTTVQHSPAGDTLVERKGEVHWLERRESKVGEQYQLDPSSIGLEAGDVGCAFRGFEFEPSFSSAGFTQLMVPVKDIRALGLSRPGWNVPYGIYVFCPMADGRIRARGFFAAFGVPEDPATGSAAAALGLYLAARVGGFTGTIEQGIECGRPSVLEVESRPGVVRVGGNCQLVATGELKHLP